MTTLTKSIIACCVVVVVLAAVAAVIIAKVNGHQGQPPVSQQPQPTPKPQASPLTTDPALINVLTAEPASNASQDAQTQYLKIVSAQGIPTSIIHLEDCKPYPEVSIVKLNQAVKVFNGDAVSHTVLGGTTSTGAAALKLTVPAHGSASFTLKTQDPLAFNYACDGAAAGAVLTSNQ